MPNFLSYDDIIKYYGDFNCVVVIHPDSFVKGASNKIIPYLCPNNHLVDNLTKNKFNTRINSGLNVCAQCSTTDITNKRIQKISKALEKAGAKFVCKNKRRVTYICKCGAKRFTYDSNVLKDKFIGCPTCANPFNNPKIQERIKETFMKKYGVNNPFQSEIIKKKIRKTNIKKYGVPNVMQNKRICSRNMKSSYNYKIYTFPSGRTEKIQGYEGRCIDELLKKYNEKDIIVGCENMPEIWYNFKGKKKKYFPDIYIPKDNLIIEVKSDYTYYKEYYKNTSKFSATRKYGYNFMCYIYNKKELESYIIMNDNDSTFYFTNPSVINIIE
tara:strand:- start:319 stop:1299 length:981 start_codon:yes stop_codon:yes gene_type:complete